METLPGVSGDGLPAGGTRGRQCTVRLRRCNAQEGGNCQGSGERSGGPGAADGENHACPLRTVCYLMGQVKMRDCVVSRGAGVSAPAAGDVGVVAVCGDAFRAAVQAGAGNGVEGQMQKPLASGQGPAPEQGETASGATMP